MYSYMIICVDDINYPIYNLIDDNKCNYNVANPFVRK